MCEKEYAAQRSHMDSGDRGLQAIWAVNLDLLRVFSDFCRRHELRFFMGFGTLLGAVRHRDFVPWDDDVDILMPRPDFERLKKMWMEFSKPYFLQNEVSEVGVWYKGMMKFRRSDTTCLTPFGYDREEMNQGIGMDIMALDEVADDPTLRRRQKQAVGAWQRRLCGRRYACKMGYSENLCESREYIDGFLADCARFAGDGSQNLAIFCDIYYHDVYPLLRREWFSETVFFDFHGLRLPAPVGFRECLQFFYGPNFMDYVPPEERRPHHYALWDTQTPYSVWRRRILGALEFLGGVGPERQLIIFGVGAMADSFWQEYGDVLENNRSYVFCVDNDSRKQGGKFYGIPIYHPEKIWDVAQDRRHIVICNGFFREIATQLESMGMDEFYVWVDEEETLFTTAIG